MAEAVSKRQRGVGMFRAAALVGALVLAGCKTMVPDARPDVQRDVPKETPTPRPVDPGIPTDTNRHRVALLVPLSGPNAAVGRSLQNATQLAILDTRSESVRITSYDTATGAAAAAQRAVADGNKLILGPLLAEDVRAVAPVARRANVPLLAFSNDTGVAGNGAYILGYTPAQSIERVVNYAARTGVTEFAGLVPTGLYGQRASTAFLRAVEGAGGRVVSLQTYDRTRASITGAVGRIGTSPYQAILIADAAGTAATAVPLIRRNSPARVLGTELWNADRSVGGQTVLNGAWFASVSDGLYRQYLGKYRARFGADPYRLSTLGYDAVLLVVRITREWRVGDAFPERRLLDADGFSGIDGAFRFGRDGLVERALEVQEVRGGTTVTVSPAPRGFGN